MLTFAGNCRKPTGANSSGGFSRHRSAETRSNSPERWRPWLPNPSLFPSAFWNASPSGRRFGICSRHHTLHSDSRQASPRWGRLLEPPGSRFKMCRCARACQALEAQSRDMQMREQALRQQLSQEQARAADIAVQSQKPSGEAQRPLLASLVFLPGLSRAGTSVQQLVLSSTAQLAHIEIQLEPRDEFPRFRAELRTRGGEDVLTRSNVPMRRINSGNSVTFDLPANALPPGEYELALKGISDAQT